MTNILTNNQLLNTLKALSSKAFKKIYTAVISYVVTSSN
nr:MAG TPA: hypothetical protein [Caudoviricetes sp.]